MITCDCKKTILLKCHKSSVFNSADQVCRQITAVDLQKEMAVIQSVSKNVNCNIDAKCNVQTFNSPSTIFDEYDYCQLSIYLSFCLSRKYDNQLKLSLLS